MFLVRGFPSHSQGMRKDHRRSTFSQLKIAQDFPTHELYSRTIHEKEYLSLTNVHYLFFIVFNFIFLMWTCFHSSFVAIINFLLSDVISSYGFIRGRSSYKKRWSSSIRSHFLPGYRYSQTSRSQFHRQCFRKITFHVFNYNFTLLFSSICQFILHTSLIYSTVPIRKDWMEDTN